MHPDFVHDTFSAFYPLAVASRAIASLRLEDHGVAWEHAPAVLGHPFADGQWAVLHRDRQATAAGLDALRAGDGDAWLDLCRTWDRIGPPLLDGLTTRSRRCGPGPGCSRLSRGRAGWTPCGAWPRRSPPSGASSSPARPPAAARRQRRPRRLPPLAPGSGVFGVLMTMLGQTVGFPVPRGGAQSLTDALVSRFTGLGGVSRRARRSTGSP